MTYLSVSSPDVEVDVAVDVAVDLKWEMGVDTPRLKVPLLEWSDLNRIEESTSGGSRHQCVLSEMTIFFFLAVTSLPDHGPNDSG